MGRDPGEWWSDGEPSSRRGAGRSCGGLIVRGSQPIGYRAGPVGWVLDRAEFVAPNGATAPFGLTTVCEQEAEGWPLVHAHFSLGVPDAEVFDESPA